VQATPEPGFESTGDLGSTSATIAWWMLVVVSCCAALVAFSLMSVSIRLSGELVAANPCFATPEGHALQISADIHTSLLAGGVAGVLSWYCAFFASHLASGPTRGPRRATSALALLMLSSLALAGLVGSFIWSIFASFCGI
jgi:hypothetical protein